MKLQLCIAFRRLACLMALRMDQFRVFCFVPVRSVLTVKLGIFKSQLVAAISTLAILLPPFYGFELGTKAGLTSLIVPKFLNYFSAIGEQQERVANR